MCKMAQCAATGHHGTPQLGQAVNGASAEVHAWLLRHEVKPDRATAFLQHCRCTDLAQLALFVRVQLPPLAFANQDAVAAELRRTFGINSKQAKFFLQDLSVDGACFADTPSTGCKMHCACVGRARSLLALRLRANHCPRPTALHPPCAHSLAHNLSTMQQRCQGMCARKARHLGSSQRRQRMAPPTCPPSTSASSCRR